MTRSILTSSAAACVCLGLASPVLAAGPAATAKPPAASEGAAATKPAEKCLTDLRAFDGQIQKDGYWLSESGYGFGYPRMGGYGFGYGYPMNGGVVGTQTGYRDVRPGYDVRTLAPWRVSAAKETRRPSFTAGRSNFRTRVTSWHSQKLAARWSAEQA